jgi:hypothetical protein
VLAETHTQRVFNTSKCVRARRCAQYLAMIALQGEDGAIWTGFKQFPGQLANLRSVSRYVSSAEDRASAREHKNSAQENGGEMT